jgi:hypothetical protein
VTFAIPPGKNCPLLVPLPIVFTLELLIIVYAVVCSGVSNVPLMYIDPPTVALLGFTKHMWYQVVEVTTESTDSHIHVVPTPVTATRPVPPLAVPISSCQLPDGLSSLVENMPNLPDKLVAYTHALIVKVSVTRRDVESVILIF